MTRQTFVATAPISIPELGVEIHAGDVVDFDPSNRREPVVVSRGHGWSAVPALSSHPHLRSLSERPVARRGPLGFGSRAQGIRVLRGEA